MSKRALGFERRALIQEAARIICEEQLADYRAAKLKAAGRLGLGAKCAMPANADIQQAVIEYQRIFGGREYALRLTRMRQTAIKAMQLLRDFDIRLVGAVATGATTDAHRVQLHGFADSAEQFDIFFGNRGIPYKIGERRYRYSDGRCEDVPMLSFMAGDIGVDIAIFTDGRERRAPLSPTDGQPMKRLRLEHVQRLAETPPDIAA